MMPLAFSKGYDFDKAHATGCPSLDKPVLKQEDQRRTSLHSNRWRWGFVPGISRHWSSWGRAETRTYVGTSACAWSEQHGKGYQTSIWANLRPVPEDQSPTRKHTTSSVPKNIGVNHRLERTRPPSSSVRHLASTCGQYVSPI